MGIKSAKDGIRNVNDISDEELISEMKYCRGEPSFPFEDELDLAIEISRSIENLTDGKDINDYIKLTIKIHNPENREVMTKYGDVVIRQLDEKLIRRYINLYDEI